MAETVKRGVLLKGLAPLAEVQKHVMKDSARLNSHAQMGAEVVDLLCAEAALHMAMAVDGTCMSDPKGKGKTKGKSESGDQKGKGKAKGKGKKGKETRVCHECNKTWTSAQGLHSVQETYGRERWKQRENQNDSCSSRSDSCSAGSNGRNVGVH